MSDVSNKWDNVVLDEDGVTNAQYSALAAGENLMELPPEILAQPALLDSYIFGVNQTINQIAISLHECMTEGDGENAVHWRQQEQIAQTRLQTAQALTKETFLAMQQELEGLELSIAKGEEHPNVDSRIAELERLMEQSPWTLIPGEGCVPRQQADQLMQSPREHNPVSIQITILNEGNAPVLCKYPQQSTPQNAYLHFHPGNDKLELIADYTGEVGNNAMSPAVFHRKELRFKISPYSSRQGLEALANDETLATMLTAVQKAYSCDWDGNNYVGKYEGLDELFEEEIERHLEATLTLTEAWDVADWIGDSASITELLEKGSIAEYAKHYESTANDNDAVLIGDCAEHLAEWAEEHVRNYLRQNTSDEDNIYDVVALLKEHDEDQYASLEEDYCEEFGNPVACRP
ncbi:hypothetical protein U1710_10395 [Aeromonas caviae]|uniref:hypothetical protein n=1 Tax=Aeromonas caviae TaxID=648 RepID=UPI003014C19A